MIENKELSITKKKKEVLDKINIVITTFQKIREDLLAIIETNEKLNTSSKLIDKQGIINGLNQTEVNLLKSIESLKERNSHRTNKEIHTIHAWISNTIRESIESIIYETKLRTIITISIKLPDLITKLNRNLKTWIWVEILALSSDKYTKINPPINLEIISEKIFEQIENINNRIKDVTNIYKVIEYLDLTENSPILDELIDYILWWKNYSEVEASLVKHWIIIEEVTITPIRWYIEDDEVLKEQIVPKVEKNKDNPNKQPKENIWIFSKLYFRFKVLREWLITDRSVNFECAKERVIEKEKWLL